MKMMKKCIWTWAIVGCTSLLMANSAVSAEWEVPNEWKFVKFAGGAASGSWTPLTAKICELINKQIPGVTASSTLGASYGNMVAVDQGKMQMGMTMTNAMAESFYGLREQKGKSTKDVRFLGSMHHGAIHIFVPKNSPIKDISEIAKEPLRTVTGPRKSFTYMFNDLLLDLYGSSLKDLEARGGTASNVYYGPGVKMLKDGQIDYMAFHTGLNASMVMDAASSPGIRFLELSPQKRAEAMKKLLGSTEVVIPKGMYPGMEKDYHTFGYYFPVVVPKDMPEELAYRITKVIWDNLEDVQSVGAFGKAIKLETAFKGMTIPMHPGSARYYRERGLTIPEIQEIKE